MPTPKHQTVIGGILTALAIAGAGLWAHDGFETSQNPDIPAETTNVTKTAQGYTREAFGPGFIDTDRNGCTQRDDALAAALTNATLDGCEPLTGDLTSPYTGATIHYTRGAHSPIDGDHLVPLKWAWLHGAATWSTERRVVFANDTDNIIMTDSSSNRAKGAAGPSGWLPKINQCDYVTRFEAVAVKYELTIPPADRTVIDESC